MRAFPRPQQDEHQQVFVPAQALRRNQFLLNTMWTVIDHDFLQSVNNSATCNTNTAEDVASEHQRGLHKNGV